MRAALLGLIGGIGAILLSIVVGLVFDIGPYAYDQRRISTCDIVEEINARADLASLANSGGDVQVFIDRMRDFEFPVDLYQRFGAQKTQNLLVSLKPKIDDASKSLVDVAIKNLNDIPYRIATIIREQTRDDPNRTLDQGFADAQRASVFQQEQEDTVAAVRAVTSSFDCDSKGLVGGGFDWIRDQYDFARKKLAEIFS